jgi:hypothetical protein
MLALRLSVDLMPPLAWAIVSDAALPAGFAKEHGFLSLFALEKQPVPIASGLGADLADRRALKLIDSDGSAFLSVAFREAHPPQWARAARSRGELGVIMGNLALFKHAANVDMAMLSLAGSGARAARLPLAVHEWGDGEGTVA